MLLFIAAAGLSLVFGVMRLLNFAHGSFFMIGAYLAWQFSTWFGGGESGFWLAVLFASCGVALLAAIIESTVFQRLYGQSELIQLLFTYALVLLAGDAVKAIWGSQQLSLARPPSLAGSAHFGSITLPHYNLFLLAAGLGVAGLLWWMMQRTKLGMVVRACAQDREMMGLLGTHVKLVYLSVFAASAFLAGFAGALVAPTAAIVPGMDTEIHHPALHRGRNWWPRLDLGCIPWRSHLRHHALIRHLAGATFLFICGSNLNGHYLSDPATRFGRGGGIQMSTLFQRGKLFSLAVLLLLAFLPSFASPSYLFLPPMR